MSKSVKNTRSARNVFMVEDLSRHIGEYGSELERIRTEILRKLRSPELFKWQPGRPGTDNKTYYIQSYDVEKLIRQGKLDPNTIYDDGTSLLTQAIRNSFYAYNPSNKVPVMVSMNINGIMDAIINGGAILTPEDEEDITQLRAMNNNMRANMPQWMGTNKEAWLTANDIITKEIHDGQYLEAGTERDLLQYMGEGRRRSRKRSSSVKRGSSLKRGGHKLSRKRSSSRKRGGRKLNGRRLKGG
jgi:hypothetical protein